MSVNIAKKAMLNQLEQIFKGGNVGFGVPEKCKILIEIGSVSINFSSLGKAQSFIFNGSLFKVWGDDCDCGEGELLSSAWLSASEFWLFSFSKTEQIEEYDTFKASRLEFSYISDKYNIVEDNTTEIEEVSDINIGVNYE